MPDSIAPQKPRSSWLRHLSRIGADHGFFDRIGARHLALFVEEGDTLVVSFDRAERTWDQGDSGLPLGFECVTALEYSLLSLIAIGRTWFRDPALETLLKDLALDGFFTLYSQVLIVATGPDCGHAAARAAQHIPGAKVLLSRPAAAISAAHAPFEARFKGARRVNPDVPPPLGPEALQNAAKTFILFDPANPSEAAQAALFRAPGTTRIGLPHTGAALDRAMARGEALVPLTRHLTRGTLTAHQIRLILRPILRRDPGYLARLENAAGVAGHPARAALIARGAE